MGGLTPGAMRGHSVRSVEAGELSPAAQGSLVTDVGGDCCPVCGAGSQLTCQSPCLPQPLGVPSQNIKSITKSGRLRLQHVS